MIYFVKCLKFSWNPKKNHIKTTKSVTDTLKDSFTVHHPLRSLELFSRQKPTQLILVLVPLSSIGVCLMVNNVMGLFTCDLQEFPVCLQSFSQSLQVCHVLWQRGMKLFHGRSWVAQEGGGCGPDTGLLSLLKCRKNNSPLNYSLNHI